MSEDLGGSVEAPVEVDESSNSFLDSVDDQYRSDPSISKFSSVNDLAKEHVNLQSLLGKKGIVVPGEDDGQEIWDRYRKDMGIPDSPETYTRSFEGKTEDGWDHNIENSMAAAAHSANISDSQFNELLSAYSNTIKAAQESNAVEIGNMKEENDAALRKEWGSAYDAKINMGRLALNQMTNGSPNDLANVQLSNGSMLGDNPLFIKMMSSMGESLQEKGIIQGESVNQSAMTPEEAQNQLSALMADPEKSAILFSQDFNPAKGELVKQRERLLSFAFPSED